MAGDWIPMRLDLDEDPAVIGIARSLNVTVFQAIGQLWKFWSVVSRQTSHGVLPNYGLDTIDAIVGQTGFGDCLVQQGWLLSRSDSLEIPNFGHWLSQSAKRRLQESQRKKNVRKMSACNADKKRTPLLLSPVLSSGEKPEEEKTTDRPENTPVVPRAGARSIAQEGARWATDGPEDPGDWPAWLATCWLHYYSGRTNTMRDLDGMAVYFRDLLASGIKPEEIRDRIRDRNRPTREPTWEFEKFWGRSRNGQRSEPSKRFRE